MHNVQHMGIPCEGCVAILLQKAICLDFTEGHGSEIYLNQRRSASLRYLFVLLERATDVEPVAVKFSITNLRRTAYPSAMLLVILVLEGRPSPMIQLGGDHPKPCSIPPHYR